jgi:hypothetical protein
VNELVAHRLGGVHSADCRLRSAETAVELAARSQETVERVFATTQRGVKRVAAAFHVATTREPGARPSAATDMTVTSATSG